MNNIVLIILIGVSILFFVVIAHKKPKKPYIPKEKKPEIKRISTGKIQELQNKIDIHKVEAKTAINRSEIQIYEVLLDAFASYNVFVSTQVSLSSLLNSKENTLWQEYKDLYSDFVLFSKETGKPIYVIEYHGSGHNPSNAEYIEENDEIKRLLFKKASIPLRIINYQKYQKEDAKYQDDINFARIRTELYFMIEILLVKNAIKREA